ncbi:MAG: GNAT family N-acetyltransferase [Pirellulales bacterium]|nr:GNAT family N-acetyltransferase [Pirellulales bacterium]
MSRIEVEVSCPVFDSFRVKQLAGLFDVPLARRAVERFCVEMPELDDPWCVGLIVGPSGSGKSTIARRLFGDAVYRRDPWPEDRAVVDCLGALPIKQITGLLTAVGFSSPPSWIKPYQVLSGGERFRCDLARALAGAALVGKQGNESADKRPLVVFDEFTSVVDRTVARIGSAAISKAIRSGRIPCRLVAVTCHYDVAEWLEADWVLDMATATFARRRLRRPPIRLEVVRCRHEAWRLFARHHYLSGSLSKGARCFLALWEGAPVAFCATLSLIGRRNRWRISRIVTLPDFQGIGIGMRLAETVADIHRSEGHRVNVTASHPALIAHCRRSPRWRAVAVRKTGSRRTERFIHNYHGSAGRAVVSFEYVGV